MSRYPAADPLDLGFTQLRNRITDGVHAHRPRGGKGGFAKLAAFYGAGGPVAGSGHRDQRYRPNLRGRLVPGSQLSFPWQVAKHRKVTEAVHQEGADSAADPSCGPLCLPSRSGLAPKERPQGSHLPVQAAGHGRAANPAPFATSPPLRRWPKRPVMTGRGDGVGGAISSTSSSANAPTNAPAGAAAAKTAYASRWRLSRHP